MQQNSIQQSIYITDKQATCAIHDFQIDNSIIRFYNEHKTKGKESL